MKFVQYRGFQGCPGQWKHRRCHMYSADTPFTDGSLCLYEKSMLINLVMQIRLLICSVDLNVILLCLAYVVGLFLFNFSVICYHLGLKSRPTLKYQRWHWLTDVFGSDTDGKSENCESTNVTVSPVAPVAATLRVRTTWRSVDTPRTPDPLLVLQHQQAAVALGRPRTTTSAQTLDSVVNADCTAQELL
jgi:hypothetical protein